MTTGSMTQNPIELQRDQLWNDSFIPYYNAYFGELLSGSLIQRWTRIDIGVKFLVAITATGSAIAGIALWQEPGWKVLWAIISSLAAVASIFHTTALVDNFIKEHTKEKKDYANCRNELEDFRHDLNMNPNFDVFSKDNEYKELKKKYDNCENASPNDWSITIGYKKRVKKQLNEILHNQIQTDE